MQLTLLFRHFAGRMMESRQNCKISHYLIRDLNRASLEFNHKHRRFVLEFLKEK